ncbi:MAG: crosslink repair DNA glycosylase YcaQ family protein [Pseudomonadota bacterium]
MSEAVTIARIMNVIDLRVNDLKKIRRIALRHQGLFGKSGFGRGLNAAQKALEHLGYVQIDTISVVERAHHHVLRSRVDNYQRDWLNRLFHKRVAFEHWAHAAAILPMRDYRYSLYMKEALRSGRLRFTRSKDKKLMREILARIRTGGPLRSRDFENPDTARSGWWDWKPAKRALEHLYMQGDLMVTHRDGFEKTYDLTERVLPTEVDTTLPSPAEMAEFLITQNLRSHGLATLKGFTYLRRDSDLRKAAKAAIDAACAADTLLPCRAPNGQVFFIEPESFETRTPTGSARAHILSPFDSAIIQRERVHSLFDFDYQIECYVPATKRRYGYFALPLLYGDRFVGVLDCKAHRAAGILQGKALHLLANDADKGLDTALSNALCDFAVFNECARVHVHQTCGRPVNFDPSIFAAREVELLEELPDGIR